MAVALVVAAGRGERLGAGTAKAFVMLAGRPLVQWSIDALAAVSAIQRIVVAIPADASAPPGTTGVVGGPVRSDSVRRALAAADGDPVLVHDAARPLLTSELATRALAGLEDGWDAVVCATRVTDTIKRTALDDPLRVEETLDRSRLWAVQTPQVFRREALERALAAEPEQLAAATDDAWLIERQGGRVRLLESPPENLKVTTPLDLRLAELLLSRR